MTLALARPVSRLSLADDLLKTAAKLWFLVAVLGQWTFVYYIAAFYGPSTLTGNFAAWNKRDLIKGYVAGDHIGNLYFAAHVLMAGLITSSGALQLFPQIRARAMTFHRWNGRLYIVTAFLMALGGLWMIWVRGTYLTLSGAVSSTILALLIMVFATMTVREGMARRIHAHHRWALRTFLVVNAVWVQRLGYMAWMIMARGPVGVGDHMDGPFDYFLDFGKFVIPLAVLEIYLRARDQSGIAGKISVATTLFALTVLMGVGIVGAYLFMWRPGLLAVSTG